MAKQNEFVNYLLELLDDFGDVRARAMFGGYGVYRSDLMFGLVADDELYLKVDDQNVAEFEKAGLEPFIYVKDGKAMKMSYYHAPDQALDNREELYYWADLGFQAALRAAAKKKGGKSRPR